MKVSTIAPSTTPSIDPSPPRITIARMKIENENWNWSAFTVFRYDPRNTPDIPPKAAPVPYASSLVLTSGTPIDAAATSSSRRAIQARPSRESRRR